MHALHVICSATNATAKLLSKCSIGSEEKPLRCFVTHAQRHTIHTHTHALYIYVCSQGKYIICMVMDIICTHVGLMYTAIRTMYSVSIMGMSANTRQRVVGSSPGPAMATYLHS